MFKERLEINKLYYDKIISRNNMKLFYILLVPMIMLAHSGEKHDKTKELPPKTEIKENKVDIYTQINEEYIKNIKPIFEVKCFNCHSDKTKQYWYSNFPIVSSIIKKDIKEAKEHLDFSKDFPFLSHDTPQKDLISILEAFEKRTMPPFKYKIMHSESKITPNDIKKVKLWVENSLSILKKEK